MDAKTIIQSLTETDADTLLVFVGEGQLAANAAQVDAALNGALAELIGQGDFSGKAGQTAVLYPRGALPVARVIAVGLGSSVAVEGVRRSVAVGIRRARELKAVHVATALPEGLETVTAAQAVVEGALLSLYSYHGQRTSEAPEDTLTTLTIAAPDEAAHAQIETGLARGRAYAKGAILARDLVNLPPNICTPEYLAQRAREMAKAAGLRCEVLEEQQIKALKMGALLGVAQGSDTPPRFIILEHNADRASELDTVVLVGKGVTFDTGGYSLKTGEGMIGMKHDMGGGAAVIGAMRIVAGLNVPLHVVGLIPTADNMISGHAYRPEDVLTASNGKTIEVISTDAEGRLLLADALVYARRYQPAAVVDIATLTGSCVVALGHAAAGLFSIDDRVRDTVMRAGEMTSERVWPLPLFPEYDKAIESLTADVKNSGGRDNGVGTSAAFLRHFVDYPAWAHVDMAGMVRDAADNPYIPTKGATGYGARLLAQFVEEWKV
ncbi:MAG: leucyl aminopeptidase [Anaerolineae bacterium]